MRTLAKTEGKAVIRTIFDDLRDEGEAKGLAKGRAASVLDLLAERGVKLTRQQRALILNTTELKQLRLWLRRATTAKTGDDLFGRQTKQ